MTTIHLALPIALASSVGTSAPDSLAGVLNRCSTLIQPLLAVKLETIFEKRGGWIAVREIAGA